LDSIESIQRITVLPMPLAFKTLLIDDGGALLKAPSIC